MTITRTILIHYEHPPIPIRSFDYVALIKGEEESGNYGYGASPQEALEDLINALEEL